MSEPSTPRAHPTPSPAPYPSPEHSPLYSAWHSASFCLQLFAHVSAPASAGCVSSPSSTHSATLHQADLTRRLHESEATVAALRGALANIAVSTTAINRLSHALAETENTGGEEDSGADDDEHSLTELFELRRWRREFSVEQTRNLVARNEMLSQENGALSERLHGVLAVLGTSLQCPRCRYAVGVYIDGAQK